MTIETNFMTLKSALILISLSCLSSEFLFAGDVDDRIQFETSKITPAPFSRTQDIEFFAFEKALESGSFDTQAQSLLGAAEEFTKAVFNLRQLKFLRAITRRDEGDVLLAEWKIEGPFAEGLLTLEDTPVFSNYVFRIVDPDLTSQQQFKMLLLNLLVFEKSPIDLPRLKIDMAVDGLLTNGFYGQVSRSATLNSIFRVSGYMRGKDLFLEVQIGKVFTQKYYYPVTPFVPERFPPLTQTVKSWDFWQIRHEIGRELAPRSGIDEYRDTILIDELVRRGLSQEQFIELLQNSEPRLSYRAGLVLGAMERANQKASITRYFEPALAMYERIGTRANSAVDSLFRAATRNCTSQFEPTAMRLMKSSKFEEAALRYLTRCASSEEMLRQIELLSVPDQLADSKKFGLGEIRKRVGKLPQ